MNPAGVFAVQCPNPKCRKWMLVEEHERARGVNCLLCKTPIPIAAGAKQANSGTPKPASPPRK